MKNQAAVRTEMELSPENPNAETCLGILNVIHEEGVMESRNLTTKTEFTPLTILKGLSYLRARGLIWEDGNWEKSCVMLTPLGTRVVILGKQLRCLIEVDLESDRASEASIRFGQSEHFWPKQSWGRV